MRVDPERELLERLRAGDPRAFDELVRRLHPTIVRLARTRVPSDAVAEEVAQETWVAVLQGLDRFEGRSSLRTWILRIAVNRAITRGIRERRSVPFASLEGEDDSGDSGPDRFTDEGTWRDPPTSFELPDDRAERLELRTKLRRALNDLPERQRMVITLRDVEGLSSEEVCEMLDLSEGNQRVLLHRARGRLQRRLAGYIETADTITPPPRNVSGRRGTEKP
jgi:RNA polymerase sigma-70 factor (ECF subfamily)